MNKVYQIILCLNLLVGHVVAQELFVKMEAEDGTFNGVQVSKNASGYSGSGFLTGFDELNDGSFISGNITDGGVYELRIAYRSQFGDKRQELYVNNEFQGEINFTKSLGFRELFIGQIELVQGFNKIEIKTKWGYVDIDYYSIYFSEEHDYQKVVPELIDPDASPKTIQLYEFLKSNYGKTIIAGQNFYWDELKAVVEKTPLLQSFDLQNYSPQNPWGWDNNQSAFVSWDDGTIQEMISWYNQHHECGMVSLEWHWFSPSGGDLRSSTFYQSNTDFDVSKAVVSGNDEYDEILRDIDAIAIQLKRLEDADIPVLWRPLHEAGGDWFWWGSKGPGPVKALWDIMYDRLVNYHDIHNLIWVWSTPEEEYYLGNDKLDVFGFDSYPGPLNYTSQKSTFDHMYHICNGEKLIAMTENGPIPNIDECVSKNAMWSYFCSWSDLVTEQNSLEHLNYVFNHEKVTTMEELCVISGDENGVVSSVIAYPNPTHDWINLATDLEKYEILSIDGVLLRTGTTSRVYLGDYQPGIYLFKIDDNQMVKVVKY